MVLEQELSQATNRLSQKLIIKIYYYQIEKLFLNAVATTILLYPASLFYDLAYSVFWMFSLFIILFHDSFFTSATTFWRWCSRMLAVFTSRPTSPKMQTRLVLIPQWFKTAFFKTEIP